MIESQESFLFSSAYLAPISYYTAMAHCDVAYVEQWENYRKQSYRNRCVIASPQGELALTIPIIKPKEENRLIRDIKISEHGKWQHLHWNALVSAYNNSPFFLYYEDELAPFYEKNHTFLFDFNMELCKIMCEDIGIEPILKLTDSYVPASDELVINDLRESISPKIMGLNQLKGYQEIPYYQVYQEQLGFLPNLSIIDLLFNMGPEGLLILKERK
ncbi:MAG: WbqC family protein [Bacteroidaceae bacterium]